MTKPTWFELKITLGNVIQGALLIFAILAAWFDMRSRVDRHETQIRMLTRNYDTMSSSQSSLATSLAVLTTIINERTKHPNL